MPYVDAQGMLVLQDDPGTLPVVPRVRRHVRIRRSWEDPWRLVQYLEPLACRSETAPAYGQATFLYRFGRIKREDSTSFADYVPDPILDHFVQVLIQHDGGPLIVAWTGIVVEEIYVPDRPTTPSGDQTVVAYELPYLLDRQVIGNARVWGEPETKEIGWHPPFNRESTPGRRTIGNRHTEVDPETEVHVFTDGSESPATWTTKEILDHLLAYHAPEAPEFELGGQVDAITKEKPFIEVAGKTCWAVIAELVSPRKGLSLVPRVDEESGKVLLEIFTTTAEPIEIDEGTLPANPQRVAWAIPSSAPLSHLVELTPFHRTSANQYATIEVRGARIKVVGTWSVFDGTLEKAWSEDLETEYIYATGDDPQRNDAFRARDRFRGVFTRFRVPKDWDGILRDATGGNDQVALPKCQPDGTVTVEDGPATWWPYGKTFERSLPFRVGRDLKKAEDDPDEDLNPDRTEPEFLPALAFVHDSFDGAVHAATDRWFMLDLASQYIEDLQDVGVRILDREMGVELVCRPRHYVADTWGDTAGETLIEPELSTADFGVTACLETDERLRFELEIEGVAGDKRLVIEVPDAEYWYGVPGTVIDIDDQGLVRLPESRKVLRDDKPRLAAIAAFHRAWYGVGRQAIEIAVADIGLYLPLGAFLDEVRSTWFVEAIRTVVSAREIDFRSGRTRIETGWKSASQGMGTPNFRGKAINPGAF